jgi:ferric-dicitrate binding protein FerR (iron transport regulator)
VAVDGEAYFEVRHIAEVPFVVQTGVVTTRVLGTSFMVRHAVGQPRVHVAVTEGKVRVTSSVIPSSGVTLGVGMMSDVVDSVMHVNTVDAIAPRAEWVRDELVFHDTPVSTVLQTMTRWYGYEFRSSDSTLLHQKVTIGVPMRSSETAFAILEDILSVNLTVSGDTVTLVPHPARSEKTMPRIRRYDVWTPAREVGR